MALQNSLTGFNIGYTFIPTLDDTVLLAADANNTKGVTYAWVVPQTTGVLAGLDLQGNALTATFVAKDLNLVFPIPFSRFKATGTNYTGSVTSVSLTSGGTGYSIASAVSTTGGTGTGAKINILAVNTGVITSISLNTAGSGYTFGDVLTVTGGGANATVTVGAIAIPAGKIIAVFPY